LGIGSCFVLTMHVKDARGKYLLLTVPWKVRYRLHGALQEQYRHTQTSGSGSLTDDERGCTDVKSRIRHPHSSSFSIKIAISGRHAERLRDEEHQTPNFRRVRSDIWCSASIERMPTHSQCSQPGSSLDTYEVRFWGYNQQCYGLEVSVEHCPSS
jgi:hypothetical protein